MMMPNGMGVPMNPNMMHGPATAAWHSSAANAKHGDEVYKPKTNSMAKDKQ